MERAELKKLMSELLAELISDAQDPVLPAEVDTGITSAATLMENIGSVIRAADDELEESNYVISSSSAYSLMASLLDMALTYEWLDDETQWQQIIGLFNSRAGELVGESDGLDIEDFDLPPEKATSIVDYILRNWVRISGDYERHTFSVDEKVFMIRSIIIGLRNSRYLSYDPWLKTLLESLRTDWQVLGGGFGNNMGSGTNPWSHGG